MNKLQKTAAVTTMFLALNYFGGCAKPAKDPGEIAKLKRQAVLLDSSIKVNTKISDSLSKRIKPYEKQFHIDGTIDDLLNMEQDYRGLKDKKDSVDRATKVLSNRRLDVFKKLSEP